MTSDPSTWPRLKSGQRHPRRRGPSDRRICQEARLRLCRLAGRDATRHHPRPPEPSPWGMRPARLRPPPQGRHHRRPHRRRQRRARLRPFHHPGRVFHHPGSAAARRRRGDGHRQPPAAAQVNGFKFHTREGGLRGEDVDALIRRWPWRPACRCAWSFAQRRACAPIRTPLRALAQPQIGGRRPQAPPGAARGGGRRQRLRRLLRRLPRKPRRLGGGQPVPRARRQPSPTTPPDPESPEAMRALSKAVVRKRGRPGRALRRRLRPRRHRPERRPLLSTKNRLIALTAAMLLSTPAGADHRHRFGHQHRP